MNNIQITLGGFAKFIGAVGGVLTTFIVVQPWTLYYIGIAKLPLVLIAATMAVFLIALLAARKWDLSCLTEILGPTTPAMLFLILVASITTAFLLLIWSQPTRQQVAQQILNDRGMFLQRQYYKTALEVGNVNGVELFGEAGFGPTLAFELLGQPAETAPDRRSVEVVLDLNHSTLREMLAMIATERPAGASYALIDSAIVYTDNNPNAQGGIPEPNEPRGDVLFSTGLSLLGHAVSQNAPEIVELLLTLGADARFATLPLVARGALPGDFSNLAIDPFLFFDRASVTENTVVPGFTPSTFARSSYPDMLAGRPPASSCDAVQPPPAPRRFLGYLRTNDDDDTLIELEIERAIGCTRYAIHTEGHLTRTADEQKEVALLTIPTEAARTDAVDVAALTVGTDPQDLAGLRQFVGRGLVIRDAFVASGTRNDERIALAESTTEADRVLGILRQSYSERSAMDCRSEDLLTVGEDPEVLGCTRWTVATWDSSAVPFLIVAKNDQATRRQMMKLSWETPEILLEPGANAISAIPLESTSSGVLQMTLAEALPRLGPSETRYTADWPTRVFDIQGEIADQAEQFLYLQVMETTKAAVFLSQLEADVDVFVEHDTDDDIRAEAVNPGTEEEKLTRVLPAGRYEVRLKALDGRSPYLLSLVGSEVPSWPIEIGGPTLEHRGRIADGEDDFIQLELERLAKVSFEADAEANSEGDVDIVILNRKGQRLNGEYQSARDGTREWLDVMLPPGRYIAQVTTLNADVTPYRLTASAKEPTVRPLDMGERVRVVAEHGDVKMFSLDIAREAAVFITVQPNMGDVDVELLGPDLIVFERSTRFGEAEEDIRRELSSGEYYIRVFPGGVSGGVDYSLVVTQTE